MTSSARGRIARGVWVAMPALFATGTIVPALITASSGPRSGVVAVWATVATVAVLALIPLGGWIERAWPTDANGGSEPTWGVAGALLGFAPLLGLGAARSWAEPIVDAHWTCGANDVALSVFGLPAMLLFVVATTALARRAHRKDHAWLARGLAVAAPLVALSAAGFVLAAASTLGRPDADTWPTAAPTRLQFGLAESRPGDVATRTIAEGVVLERTCEAVDWAPEHRTQCTARLLPADGARTGTVHESRFAYGPTEALVLRHDPTGGWWILEGETSVARRTAFTPSTLTPTTVRPRDLGATVAAPRPLVAVAAAGLLLSLLVLVSRARLARRRRALREARAGRVDGADVIFDDGELPARGLVAEAVVDGPALAVPVIAPGAPAYRDDGARGRWQVTAGTRAEQLQRLERTIAGRDLLGLALAAISAAPLLPALASVL